ncbi:putative cytochrome P450 [Phyllosticta paracitricarpa]
MAEISSYFFLAFAMLGYIVFKIVYRLVFHPLASVPGDKIAAATLLYEFFWDAVMGGKYVFRIAEMHEKHGPVVRISRREVHVNDPCFFDVLYTSRDEKDEWFYNFDGTNTSVFATGPHNAHRRRRGALARLFTVANVAKVEPALLLHLQKLFSRMDEARQTGEVFNCSDAFRCLTMDTISGMTEPQCRNALDSPDFARSFHRTVRVASASMTWQRYLPVLTALEYTPRCLLRAIDPNIAGLLEKREELQNNAKKELEGGPDMKDGQSPTALHALGVSKILPQEDKNVWRMAIEAETLLNAGTETTGLSLAMMVYHLHKHPNVFQRLKSELLACSPLPKESFVDFQTLNRLPYLQAVIQETLRVTCPVSGRLPRINSARPLVFAKTIPNAKTYVFPPGTVISMSIMDLHHHASIFTNPKEFVPERWLDEPGNFTSEEQRRLMRKYLLPFGKGSRSCIGLELAKLELVLSAGNLFRRFDLELFETTERDMEMAHDWIAPFGHADSEGLRVKIK